MPLNAILYHQCRHCATVSDFIELLSEYAEITRTHHYTTKSQASYLLSLLSTIIIPVGEIIVLLDFAENDSFVCQNARKDIIGKHLKQITPKCCVSLIQNIQ